MLLSVLTPLLQGAEISRAPSDEPRQAAPVVAPASDEGEQAIRRFKTMPGFKVELIAAEPLLANAVAFTIDEQNRFYTSETYRYRSSVLDIRHYMFMLEDDMACRTVEDRANLIAKHFGKRADDLGIETEVIRQLVDTDGDGKLDKSTVFSADYNSTMDGIASGVLARRGKVYFTNIPHVWELEDKDGDGVADERRSMSYGYGVRFSYTGHDLHGLVIGPDGRLYFSVGDRGANVKTREGRVLAYPDEGAVFRCNLDGSELEVVHRGLRNPQELVFDDFGNLFTGDNDCDNGDHERLVYIVEGGESGWRVGYQHAPLGKAGQWMTEKLWVPHFEGQAAYLLPPLANLWDGPSGFTVNPGVGFPAELDGHFFLTHFKGSPANSGVSTFTIQPDGAGFSMGQQKQFIWNCLPTDVDFGYDGAFYFSDWHDGWPKSGKGRIYRVTHAAAVADPRVAEVRELFAKGFAKLKTKELAALLAHADRRVRQEAQFSLVEQALGRTIWQWKQIEIRKPGSAAIDALERVAQKGTDQRARLHAIWGMGMIGRKRPEVMRSTEVLLKDGDPEVRAQAAKVLGETGYLTAYRSLVPLLNDPSLRVRFFAANALGRLGKKEAVQPVISMLRDNADKDIYLRHAGVMALVGIKDTNAIVSASNDASPAVRMAALLAMRRLEMPQVARFLSDSDPLLILEAARAINDVPIKDALPELARLIENPPQLKFQPKNTKGETYDLQRALMLRVLNANFRVGQPANARALAEYAKRTGDAEAVIALGAWEEPPRRDRIMGVYRPLALRERRESIDALQPVFGDLLASKSGNLVTAAIDAAIQLRMQGAGQQMASLVASSSAPAPARARAIFALGELKDPKLSEAVKRGLADDQEVVRKEALRQLAKLGADEATEQLADVLKKGSIGEKQNVLSILGDMKSGVADKLVGEWLGKLKAGEAPRELHLEIVDSASKRKDASIKASLAAYESSKPKDDLTARYRETLYGGDAENGRKVFLEKVEGQCLRCHKWQGSGGDVGPSMDGIGKKYDREYLLQSIVDPSAKIAEGFENLTITLKEGGTYVGIFKGETDKELTIFSQEENDLVRIPKTDIAKRATGLSGMLPGLGEMLTRRELRDLVEFLAQQK